MSVNLGILPNGFEGPNAIRKLFGLLGGLDHDKEVVVKLDASIGVPGVPSRHTDEYPSVALPNYTQTPGGQDIQKEIAKYYSGEELNFGNAMVTPGTNGAFSHLVRSTIVPGSVVYIDPNCANKEAYQEIVARQGGVVVDDLSSGINPAIIVCDDANPSAQLNANLNQYQNSLIFADGNFLDQSPAQISAQSSVKDRLVMHRYVPSCISVEGKELHPDLGMVYTSAQLERENGTQPLIQRLCAAQEHAQTCMPDVCMKDLQKVLSYGNANLAVFNASRDIDVTGSTTSRDLTAQEFNRYTSGANADNVMLSYGGTGVLFNFVHAAIPTDGVIGMFDPYFAAYDGPLAEKNIGKVKMGLTPEGRPNLDNFEYAIINNKLDAVLINNPCNPTGLVWTVDELERTIEILANNPGKAKIFLDDTYRELVFNEVGEQVESQPFMTILEEKIINSSAADSQKYQDLKQKCVVQISTAKEIGGDPAKRCGMAYVPDAAIYDEMKMVQQLSVGTMACHIDRYAAAVLEQRNFDIENNRGIDPWLEIACATYGHRAILAQGLTQSFNLEGESEPKQIFEKVANPNGGFFLMLKLTPEFQEKFYGKKIPEDYLSKTMKNPENLPKDFRGKTIMNDTDIAEFSMLESWVIMVPGSGFHFNEREGAFRLSCSRINEDINLEKIANAINNASKILEPSRVAPVSTVQLDRSTQNAVSLYL
ncbi:MAG: aminotransferase class I/II-fold pyridoxal phosphate-dependent enzyme [Pseudomonadota bacterium]